jgi:hypothetical protein
LPAQLLSLRIPAEQGPASQAGSTQTAVP